MAKAPALQAGDREFESRHLHDSKIWEFSSVGSEHLIYIQRVGGSSPSTPTMELKFKTDVGELTAVLLSDTIDGGSKTVWTAWIKEYAGVITQADTIQEALEELPRILDLFLRVQADQLVKGEL